MRSVVRRPLQSRNTRWAKATAGLLIRLRVQPNHISLISVAFAATAGFCFYLTSQASNLQRAALFLVAAGCIQLRLLCNLLDGMVAIEGGFGSPAGEVYNDFPDRISDVLILAPAGYSIAGIAWGRELGWITAVLALLSAYTRVLGASLGLAQDFSGPMAKPHRMFALALACLIAAMESLLSDHVYAILAGLILIAFGTVVTISRRLGHSLRQLSRPSQEDAHGSPSSARTAR